jgi:hypothetical protein
MKDSYCREKNVSFNYIFFLIGFACLRSGEKGAPLEVSFRDEVMKQLLHLIMKNSNRISAFRLPLVFLSLFGAYAKPLVLLWSLCLLCVFFSFYLLREGQMG